MCGNAKQQAEKRSCDRRTRLQGGSQGEALVAACSKGTLQTRPLRKFVRLWSEMLVSGEGETV
jgi:hypothetical protein